MPQELKDDIIIAILKFIDTTSSHCHPLVEWQWLLGWINWGLNTFLLLKLGLQSSYSKIQGKSNAHALIYLNKQVLLDLHWVSDTLDSSTNLFYFDVAEWFPSDMDMVIYCGVCLTGLVFYCPQ